MTTAIVCSMTGASVGDVLRGSSDPSKVSSPLYWRWESSFSSVGLLHISLLTLLIHLI